MRILHPFGHEKKRNDENPIDKNEPTETNRLGEQNAWKKPPLKPSLTPVNRWPSFSA
jgi:hypothetical protein